MQICEFMRVVMVRLARTIHIKVNPVCVCVCVCVTIIARKPQVHGSGQPLIQCSNMFEITIVPVLSYHATNQKPHTVGPHAHLNVPYTQIFTPPARTRTCPPESACNKPIAIHSFHTRTVMCLCTLTFTPPPAKPRTCLHGSLCDC